MNEINKNINNQILNNNNFGQNNSETKKNDIIVLNHLVNIIEDDKPDNDIFFKKKEKIIIIEEKEKLKEESLKKYYKIENDKIKEIQNVFNNSKLKIMLKHPKILSDEKMYIINENIIKIYDNKFFNGIHKINCIKKYEIKSAIELDNKDLIIFITDKGSYKLLVYRLKNNVYNLIQTIKESTVKLAEKESDYYHGLPINYDDDKYIEFNLKYIKKLSDNRFMSVSNYDIKLYSLNKNEIYEIIFIYNDDSSYKDIYEIDGENYLIIDSIYKVIHHYGNWVKANYDITIREMIIKKIRLNKITKIEKEKILEELDGNKDLILSLKLKSSEDYSTCVKENNLSNYIILKNKYLLIQSEYILYIFNLSNLEKLAQYKILNYGKNNIHNINDMSIQKWKCFNDNEFFVKVGGNITLFKLEEEKEINLKVIAFSYFPELGNLYKINQENKFFIYEDNCIKIY